MNRDNELLAGILNQGTRAFAGYAANELLQQEPQASEGFGVDPFSGWQNWLNGTLEELAAAVAADNPQSFNDHVQWGKAVLAARGISSGHVRKSLECTRRVLDEELPENVSPLAKSYVDQALAVFDEQPEDVSATLLPDTAHGNLSSAYILALLEGDRRRASQLILDAAGQGQTVRDLVLSVLLPAQSEVGRMWLANEITVSEEHFASATTKAVMAQLLPLAEYAPRNDKTFLAAAVAGNQHDIGLQAVADFFEMDGWRTIHLGANCPVSEVAQAVVHFKVDLLGLSASQSPQLQTLKETIDAVKQAELATLPRIVVGGLAFAGSPDLAAQLGADGYAADPLDAVSVGRRLLGLPSLDPEDRDVER